MPEVSSFNPNPDVSEYSPYGRNYGNGVANLLAFSSFGFNYAPKPEGAQGMYDAYYQRERSKQFMNIQADAFSNNMLFKQGGFDPENNMLQFAGKAFGSPDGAVARMLSPLIGGNPMAAQMQLYAGLSGASTMGAFGRAGDVSKSETDEMMKVIEKNFYRTTPIDQVEADMDKEFSDKLIKNPELAQQLGFGVPLTETGEVDEGKVGELKERGARRAEDAEGLKALEQEVKINTQKVKRQYNPKLKENLTPKLEGVLKDLGVTEEKMAELKDPIQPDITPTPTPTSGSTPAPTAPSEPPSAFNLGAVRETIAKAEEQLKTPEDYNNQLSDRMAEMMDLPKAKKNILTRETVLEGGVPVNIDGKQVPTELHTQEQRDKINMARQAQAANDGLIAPEQYGKGVDAADPALYADITPPEQNNDKRKQLKQQVREGYRLLESIGENENNRKYEPEQFRAQTQNLEERLRSTGLVNNEELGRNKTASGVIPTEFVKSVETKSNTAVEKIETLTRNLKENENKTSTPEYDQEVSQAITDKIKETLKKDFNVSDEQLNSAVNNKGMINPEFVQKQVDRQTTNVQGALALAKDTEQTAAKKPIDRDTLTSSTSEISGLVSNLNENELKSATQGYDRDLSKSISDSIKKKLKDAFETTEDELSGAMNARGLVDVGFVQEKVAKQTEILQKQERQKQREAEQQAQEGEPVDLEANQQRQTEIRKILKDKYKVTDEELAKATDEQGNIKSEFIAGVYSKEMDQAEIEKAGLDYDKVKAVKLSKEAPKIRSQQLDRQMRSNEITSIRTELEDLGDTDTESANARRKKLKEDLLVKLKGIGVSNEDIAKNKTSGGGFFGIGGPETLDSEFIDKKQAEYTKFNFAQVQAAEMERYQKAGVKYSGINFEKTRGFNIEDFTSAFTAAADLRLIGGKGTPTQKMDDFMKNSGGALSAARSVFGNNLSGGQLVGKISDLLGTDTQNLASGKGSAEVEKTLRDVKSTARVAGTSIEALLGIISTANDVAKNNPKLRYLSASSITDMSMKAMSTTSAMATVMSSEEYRKSGGTQQIASERMGEKQKLLSGDLGQSLVALQQRFASDPKKLEAFREVMRKGGYDKNGLLPGQLPKFLGELSEATGVGTGDLVGSMNSTYLREQGMKNKEFANTALNTMEKTGVSMFWKSLEQGEGGKSKEEHLKEFEKMRKENPSLTFTDYVSQFAGVNSRAANTARELGQTINEDVLRNRDPAAFARIEELRDEQTKLDTDLDKKLASRNAPVVTQIMSELASGTQIDAAKAGRLMGIFADENVYKDKGESERLKQGFTDAISAANSQDAEGIAEGLSSATEVDVSEQDVNNIMEGGRLHSDYKSAQLDFQNLLTNGADTPEAKKRLKAYNKMKELGLIDEKSTDPQKAYETLQSGEGKGAVVAGVMAAEKNKKDKVLIDETRNAVGATIENELIEKVKEGSNLITAPEKEETKKLMALYTGEDGKVDMVRMMKEADEGTGAFDAGSETGAQFKEGLETEGSNINLIKERLTKANDQVEATAEQVKGTGEGEGTQQDMPKLLNDLITKLDSGNLVTAIESLGRAVAGNL